MKDTRQYSIFTVFFSAATVGVIVFLFASVMVTPFIMDFFSDSTTKAINFFIAIVATYIYWHITFKNKSDFVYRIFLGPRSKEDEASHKKWLLILAAIALFMAPFGFAGILEARGGGTFSPLYGGSLCLVSGILLLYFYFKRS